MKRALFLCLIVTAAFPVGLFPQTEYSEYLKILTETEQTLLLPINEIDFDATKKQLQMVLSSHYDDLYPGARTLLFLTEERMEQWKIVHADPGTAITEQQFDLPRDSHFTKPAYVSATAGVIGYVGFLSLKLWADSVYYNEYLSYGTGQEADAARAKDKWRAVDTASYISFGLGSLGLILTPVLNNYGSTRPRRIDNNTAVLLESVSTEQKYNTLLARREALIKEHEKAVRRKPAHKVFTLTSLGLTIASGIATGVCTYLGREAYLDYSSAVYTEDAEKARKDVEFYDMLTISTAAATGLFTLSTAILVNTNPNPEELEREILAINYQLENWIGF